MLGPCLLSSCSLSSDLYPTFFCSNFTNNNFKPGGKPKGSDEKKAEISILTSPVANLKRGQNFSGYLDEVTNFLRAGDSFFSKYIKTDEKISVQAKGLFTRYHGRVQNDDYVQVGEWEGRQVTCSGKYEMDSFSASIVSMLPVLKKIKEATGAHMFNLGVVLNSSTMNIDLVSSVMNETLAFGTKCSLKISLYEDYESKRDEAKNQAHEFFKFGTA